MSKVKEEEIVVMLTQEQIMRKRVLYVGDRVAVGVCVSFLFLIAFILIFFKYDNIIVMNPWFFLFLVITGLFFFLWYVSTNDEFYYSEHVFANSNFVLVELVWICYMCLISSFFAFFYGWQHVLEITLLYLLLYVIGYVAGRSLWLNWKKLSKKAKITLILFIIIFVLAITIIIGTIFLNVGNVRMCIFVYILGIGSLSSMGLNVLMLHLYYDKSGNDVLEDPPSMLIIIGIINTLIVSFIVWIIMIIFIPLIPGSKRSSRKSSKASNYHKKGSRRRIRWPRIYRTRRYYFFGAVIKDERPSVEYYWDIAMGKKVSPISYKKSQIENAKNKIINILFEEGIIPSNRDFQRISDIPHPLFDYALDDLKDDKKIKYLSRTKSPWWSKGYCLTEDFSEKLKQERGEIKREKIVEEFNEKVEKFLNTVKRIGPIPTKYKLWDIANEIGITPRWRITPTIEKLKKEKKIKYSRKKPKGWYIP